MTKRTVVSDEQIRSMLASRTGAANVTDLLDEIGRRSASTPQIRTRGARPMRQLGVVGALGATVLIIALVVTGRLLPAVGSPAVIHPNASPGAPRLSAGRWITSTLRPPIAFSVPEHLWTATSETPLRLSLATFLASTATAGDVSFAWLTGTYAAPCAAGAAGSTTAWHGSTAQDFMTWLRGVSPVDPGSPSPVSIAGHPGLEVEFSVPPGTEARCPAVALTHELALGPDGSTDGSIAVPLGTDRVRIAAVVIDSRTLIVVTDTSDPVHFGEIAAVADALIQTVEVR